ncbi:hypothetical protein NW762_014076 [Fusarium torreyae]|uniref:LysM domain-containing protein n=1 Tax=Fusarium torreyae TaxID=1237075 RepID=A0A9W8V712_9HYPO|nr:hypothetical protein NW762_014076 [Fusarium torreyae]
MHPSTLLVQGLLAVGATAFRGRRVRRQDGTVDPGQPSDCTWWETKEEDYQDCAYLEDGWGLKHSQFVEYNPSVKDDCSGMQFGHSYCVEVNNGLPREGISSSQAPTTSQPAEPEPTKASGPSPTQEGLINTCTTFYQAKKGDTCAKIIAEHNETFDQDDLFKWNPALGKDCSGVWANYYYCVGVPGTPTKKPSVTTSKPTATATGLQTPSPIQDGMVKNCNKFHPVAKTTTCSSIEKYYNLPLSQFLAWNPAVGKDCSGLWANYYVCVSVEGYKPSATTTTTAKATTTKATTTIAANGISTPTPIQDDMVKNCNKFHMVKTTTTCDSIQNYYSISMADFAKWNPAVGAKCTGLWANYNVCVGVIGGTPTKPSTGVTTPSPIQSGMVSNCKKFHPVASTTTCDSIQKYYKITMAQLVKWNPAVGSKCTGLWAKYYVCVGV